MFGTVIVVCRVCAIVFFGRIFQTYPNYETGDCKIWHITNQACIETFSLATESSFAAIFMRREGNYAESCKKNLALHACDSVISPSTRTVQN
jgi:hypothetical protein